jgi:hypothetical protein
MFHCKGQNINYHKQVRSSSYTIHTNLEYVNRKQHGRIPAYSPVPPTNLYPRQEKKIAGVSGWMESVLLLCSRPLLTFVFTTARCGHFATGHGSCCLPQHHTQKSNIWCHSLFHRPQVRCSPTSPARAPC